MTRWESAILGMEGDWYLATSHPQGPEFLGRAREAYLAGSIKETKNNPQRIGLNMPVQTRILRFMSDEGWEIVGFHPGGQIAWKRPID